MKARPKIIITDKDELKSGSSGQENAPPVLPVTDSAGGSAEAPAQVVTQPAPQPNRGSNAIGILSILIALAVGVYVFWSRNQTRSPQMVTERTQTEQPIPATATPDGAESPRSSEGAVSPEFSNKPDLSRPPNGSAAPVVPDGSGSGGGTSPSDSSKNSQIPNDGSDQGRADSSPPTQFPTTTDSPPPDTQSNAPETIAPSNGPYEVPGFFSINVPGGWTTYVEGKSYHFKLSADVAIIITDSDNSAESELEQAERADHAKSHVSRLLYKKHRLLNSPNEHIAVDSEGNPRHAVALIYEEKSPDTNAMRYMEKFCFRHYVNGTPVAAFLTIIRPLDNFKSYQDEINIFLNSLKWTDR